LTVALTALIAGALTAGCDPVQPTVTNQQAVERVAARAHEAFAQLPPGASLTMRSHEPAMPCDGDGSHGRTFVETEYTIDYPPSWPIEQTLTTLASYWQRASYKTVRDDRKDPQLPELVVEHPHDGFRIGYLLKHADNGHVDGYLTSSSPCS
jgi:hypothetical protein